jgi:signal transduction histidine kinase
LGSGIEKDELTKIFDRFYQVLNVNRSDVGFGLGLYISAQLIKRQNGKVWVRAR